MTKPTLIRITTVPMSLDKLIEGQMSYMKSHFEVLAISSPGKLLEEVGIKEGVPVTAVKMTRKITPIQDLISVYMLYMIFKKKRPHIVHTHTPKAGIVGSLAAYLAGVPIRLHTVAGLPLLESRGLKRILLNLVEKLTYACSTHVYPNSYVLKEIILKNRFTQPNKLKVIANGSSNGIDTSHFNPNLFSLEEKNHLKKKLEIQKDDFVFIFVGRIVKDKGLSELVGAFNEISIVNKNVKLLLVGPKEKDLDPLSKQTQKLIEDNKQIVYLGYKKDVRPYFAVSNVLVFPSYREGFPNVVMQAGAMGLPSIVSDINGCNEIIVDKKNGMIIPVKNTEALFLSMDSILKNEKLRNELIKNSRLMIQNRFEQKQVWDSILFEYKKQLTDVH